LETYKKLLALVFGENREFFDRIVQS